MFMFVTVGVAISVFINITVLPDISLLYVTILHMVIIVLSASQVITWTAAAGARRQLLKLGRWK